MKKTTVESHRFLCESVQSDWHELKVVSLAWKTKAVLSGQNSLKMRNSKHNSMKIVPNIRKAFRIFGKVSSSHFKTFKNSRLHSNTTKSVAIWIEVSTSGKTILHARNAAWTLQNKVVFDSDYGWWRKMDPLRQPEKQKIICETWPSSQINSKDEYPWG